MTQSTSTQPDAELILRGIHKAAQVKPDDPNYVRARAIHAAGIAELQKLYDAQSAVNRQEAQPSQLASALVGFGHGASMGLAGDPEYLRMAREANPWTTNLGDAAGVGASAAIGTGLMGSMKLLQGVSLAGRARLAAIGTGALRQAGSPDLTGIRGLDMALGAAAPLAGEAGLRVAGKLVPDAAKQALAAGARRVGEMLSPTAPVAGSVPTRMEPKVPFGPTITKVMTNFRSLFAKDPAAATGELKQLVTQLGVPAEQADAVVASEVARTTKLATPAPPTPVQVTPNSSPTSQIAAQELNRLNDLRVFLRNQGHPQELIDQMVPAEGVAPQSLIGQMLTALGEADAGLAAATVKARNGYDWVGFHGILEDQLRQVRIAPEEVLELATKQYQAAGNGPKPFHPKLFQRMVQELKMLAKQRITDRMVASRATPEAIDVAINAADEAATSVSPFAPTMRGAERAAAATAKADARLDAAAAAREAYNSAIEAGIGKDGAAAAAKQAAAKARGSL